MSRVINTETRVSLKSCPEYLPRVRRIAACLADRIGMSEEEVQDTQLALTEACVNAIRRSMPPGIDGSVSITLSAFENTFTADVTDCAGPADISSDGMGMRIVQGLADSVQCEPNKTGLTMRLVKRARKTMRTRGDVPAAYME